MAYNTLMNKFSEGNPSDEAAGPIYEHDDDGVSLGYSGSGVSETSSVYIPVNARSRGELTPKKSPGGSAVLARVQMFEAHNAKIPLSPARNQASPVATKVVTSVSVGGGTKKFGAKSNHPTTAPYITSSSSKNSTSSSSKDSSSDFQASMAPEIHVPVLERKQMGFHQIVANPTPEEPEYNKQKLEPRWNPITSTDESNYARDKEFSRSIPDTVEHAVDKAIAESNELSERRRKMAMAKKHAANVRANSTEKQSSPSSTDPLDRHAASARGNSTEKQSSPVSTHSAARITPDPLDREAHKKQDNDVFASPNRMRKFRMVEASMKKNLLKEKGPDSIKTNSSSSSISISSADFGAEPGVISSKFSTEQKNTSILLDRGLPTINSNENSSFNAENDYIVSPSSLPGKRDRRRESHFSDFSSVTSPGLSEGGDLGQSMFGQGNMESPARTSRSSPRQKGFHHTDSAKKVFNMSDAQFSISTPTSNQRQSKHDYFAPINLDGAPNLSFNDDGDDETQFNSVSMQDNCDKNKSKDSFQPSGHASSPNSHEASAKGSDGGSYFFAGSNRMVADESQDNNFLQNNVRYQNDVSLELPRDDDAESYTDSVTNGSWTGRMRARKAMEQTMNSEKIDQRIDPRLNGMSSNRNASQHNDDSMTVTDRVISTVHTVQEQQKAAMSDAQEGFKTFTTEDPKNAAIGLGVAGVLCGAIMFGPLGIVLGAAGVGVGYKFSSMPEDERSEVKTKASSAMHKLQESAVAANETISTSCATACGNPQYEESKSPANETMMRSNVNAFSPPQSVMTNQGLVHHDSHPVGMNLKVSNVHLMPKDIVPNKSEQHQTHPSRARQIRRLTPACRRMGRITPVGQIHSLDPALHPRAWLDVMACDWTTRDEKNEAMEEILLLAKDKSHSRMLLDEGILDSLMYILRAFFFNYADVQRENGEHSIPVETYMSDPNFFHSKLAANCCVAFGKAHCAMVRTSGEEIVAVNADGPVPITEQVAKMLYEVPHHMAMKTESEGEIKEVFKITTEMSEDQAEDLASSIVSLSMGKIEIRLQEF
mmetsp:Transcript_7933/g.11975  ORF Transcript_7933/g.11975 Transcript_7933/m.11975 type:complete len:1052 (+) Transcript_7933:167-3322(+)